MKILLLRSSGEAGELFDGVDVLVTHEVAPLAEGIAEAAAFDPLEAALVVSSQSTIRVMSEAGHGLLFAAPWGAVHAVGSETARALEAAGARGVKVAKVPGAAGLLAELPAALAGARFLWPRGSDADGAPLAELARRGAQVVAPVVYEKRPCRPEPDTLSRLLSGKYDAIAVSSLAAFDALLSAMEGVPLPPVRWGVIGPESARTLVARGLPEPVVPPTAKIADLIEALRVGG